MDKRIQQHPEMDTFLNYKWIRIYANEWLHEECFNQIEKLNLNKNFSILILWAGWWAFDQRLIDNWYINITAVDLFPEDYKANNKNIIKKDLNKDFWDIWKFDLIIAMEVIEHLENPFHFIRNLEANLSINWVVLLSTPSIESKYYRLMFLLTWEMNYFSPYALENWWHITPIFRHLLDYNLSLNKLYIESISTNRLIWITWKSPNLKITLFRLIWKFTWLFIKWDDNDLVIHIIKRQK